MSRLLVTGGAGFIGSDFVRYLVDNTDVVVPLVAPHDAVVHDAAKRQ